ncbi:hypothetical protein V6N12_025823 [Hibiscus sabdariffa]|uniref:Protein kinase domain-containing protein n=1 Tax=Hibiscus sabdariffa TaxID=183260 RepID=A0ABR2DPY6_9ROSI
MGPYIFSGDFLVHLLEDKLEANAHETVRKEEVANHEQLSLDVKKLNLDDEISKDGGESSKRAQSFTFEELTVATDNFRSHRFLGSGGFGKVYKGLLEKTNQVVAVKQLDRNGLQGIKEFVVEVLTLSMVEHPNLVKLIGFCAFYEYMPLGSLENHLLDLRPGQKPLDWNTRMKIAAGAARGLEYLHVQLEPPIIYRDLKCSNILLGDGYHPILVWPNLGVVLLELVTGRKAIDHTRERGEENLVAWARPLFKERKNFSRMVDPLLQGQYPVRGLYQALAIAAMCVQEQPNMRPVVSEVVMTLNTIRAKRACHHRQRIWMMI